MKTIDLKETKERSKIVSLPQEVIDILTVQANKDRRSVKSYMELILIKAAENLSK